MRDPLLHADELSRRRFIAHTASALLGVGLLPGVFTPGLHAADTATRKSGGGTAKNVIYLYMDGGMSHVDTWDPKEGEVMGPTKVIKTSADGIRVGAPQRSLLRSSQAAGRIRGGDAAPFRVGGASPFGSFSKTATSCNTTWCSSWLAQPKRSAHRRTSWRPPGRDGETLRSRIREGPAFHEAGGTRKKRGAGVHGAA